MKAHYKTKDARLVFEIQGETIKDLFRGIGQLQEIFESGAACGACQSASIHMRTRTVEDNEYFEMVCMDCRARLEFGQHKKGGTLFAKRKGSDGQWLPNSGWKKWENQTPT